MSDTRDPGGWLKDQMDRRKLTQRDVAQAVGLREQAVYYWLSNRTAPKDEAAAKLAALLDVPEIEVRRHFNLWIPEDGDPEPARSTAELEEIMADLTMVLDRFRRWRSGD